MKSTSAKVIGILSLLFFVNSASAQTLKEYYDSSRANIQKSNFAGALPWLEKAKVIALANPKDTNSYVEVLKLMAVSYAKTAKLLEAEGVFKEVVVLYNQMPSKKAPFSVTLQNFGVFYYNQKKYTEAEPIFLKALEVKKSANGIENAEYISILNSYSSTLINLKKTKEALSSYLELADLRKKVQGDAHPDYYTCLNSIASIYKGMEKYQEALKINLQMVNIVKQMRGETSKDYALAVTNLAVTYKLVGELEMAESNFGLAVEINRKAVGEGSPEYAISLLNLAGLYRLTGKYEQAEPYYFNALEIYKQSSGENSAEFGSVLNNVGLFYSESGRYDLAEGYFRQALDNSKKNLGEKSPETTIIINNLGLLYKSMGRYDQAEPILKKALKIRKEVQGEKSIDYATSLNNLGSVYESMGRYDQAEIQYKQSLSIIKELVGENTILYGNTTNNLAGVYEAQGKFSLAEPLYSKALEIIKGIYGENHISYTTTLNNLALLQQSMGKKDAALVIYKKNVEAIKIQLGEKHPNYATAMSNYAVLLENLGKYTEAESFFLQVLSIRIETLGENHPSCATSWYDLAKLYASMKNFPLADSYWDKTLESYLYQIQTYFPNLSEKEKGKFYSLIQPKFEQFYSYVELRQKENPLLIAKMYDYQLATKALLLSSTNKVKQRILASGDQLLINKFKNWNAKKELLSKAFTLSKAELKEQDINLDELISATNELEKELSAESELFKTTNDNQKVSWIQVQKKLKADEAAVEVIRYVKYRFDSAGYYQNDSIHYAALFINSTTKGNPEMVLLKNGAELERQMVKYYRNAIKFKNEDDLSYRQYWERFRTKLTGFKTLYFSVDGVYNQISINTLYNVPNKTYLVDELDVKVLSNTKDLLNTQGIENPEKRITLIGSPDFAYNARNVSKIIPGISTENASFIERSSATMLEPLPGTKIEVEKISGMMGGLNWKTELYTEQNALEEAVKRQLNPKVLHIATHGFFAGDASKKKVKKSEESSQNETVENPLLNSGLLLAGSALSLLKKKNDQINIDISTDKTKDDGILTAYEAMNLNLEKTDLVILSACETGLGEVKNGEGVYGLQRSFTVAGAKAIIISLWSVNDAATQKLMTNFYQEWIKVGNKRLAFKNAQKMLKAEMPEPYFWGAFVMIGE